MTKIMIVEEDPAYLSGFCRSVTREPEFELCAAVCNGAAAREVLARLEPDVLWIDLELPDTCGIEIIRETSARYPRADIMVVTVLREERHVLASIAAGASGYLLKDGIAGSIVTLIRELRAGGAPMSPAIARMLLKQLRTAQRSPAVAPATSSSPWRGARTIPSRHR